MKIVYFDAHLLKQELDSNSKPENSIFSYIIALKKLELSSIMNHRPAVNI